MRRIDLSSYTVPAKAQKVCSTCHGTGFVQEEVAQSYNVRESLIEALFHPDLKLPARELLDREDLARRMRDCPDGYILLEEEEYNKVLQAVNSIRGYTKPDIEFVRRILNAEKVNVQAGSV